MGRDRLLKGLIQVYTGNNKGKSTAAFGLVMRAIGHGFKAYIVQFMKGSTYYGEHSTWQRLYPAVQFSQYGRGCPHSAQIRQGEEQCRGCGSCFVQKGQATAEDRELALRGLAKAQAVLTSGDYDIVVLDEVINAVYFELLTVEEVLSLLDHKPDWVEVVLTGRNAPQALIERADLVTEMVQIKHPFDKGLPSRRGIEY